MIARLVPLCSALLALATGAQLLKGKDAGLVSVFPDRRQAVAPHGQQVDQRSLFLAQALFASQHAWLAALASTPGAGTGPAQGLPVVDTLVLIAPTENQLALLLVQQKRGRSWMIILRHVVSLVC